MFGFPGFRLRKVSLHITNIKRFWFQYDTFDIAVGPVDTGNWTCYIAGLYQTGVTSLIAHFRIAGVQIALETKTNVVPRAGKLKLYELNFQQYKFMWRIFNVYYLHCVCWIHISVQCILKSVTYFQITKFWLYRCFSKTKIHWSYNRVTSLSKWCSGARTLSHCCISY